MLAPRRAFGYCFNMRRLYHIWLSPACRKVRIVLGECGLDFELKVELPWERRAEFLKLNPSGEVPVLIEPENLVIADATAISEYLDECYAEPSLFGENPVERAESRRLVAWFDGKFAREVSAPLTIEKIEKRFLKMGAPNADTLRSAAQNLSVHLNYIDHLIARRNYLAGGCYSMADIAAASHISFVDYLGDIDWDAHTDARDWYSKVKSRKSFRSVLKDRIAGLVPPKYYDKLDF